MNWADFLHADSEAIFGWTANFTLFVCILNTVGILQLYVTLLTLLCIMLEIVKHALKI